MPNRLLLSKDSGEWEKEKVEMDGKDEQRKDIHNCLHYCNQYTHTNKRIIINDFTFNAKAKKERERNNSNNNNKKCLSLLPYQNIQHVMVDVHCTSSENYISHSAEWHQKRQPENVFAPKTQRNDNKNK